MPDLAVEWGDDNGVNWDNADQTTKEDFALVRLYWFYKMVTLGGPDGSELDEEVRREAQQAAEWYGPILHARADSARSGRSS